MVVAVAGEDDEDLLLLLVDDYSTYRWSLPMPPQQMLLPMVKIGERNHPLSQVVVNGENVLMLLVEHQMPVARVVAVCFFEHVSLMPSVLIFRKGRTRR